MFRSTLFIPGNNPSMVQNASVFGADAVIFDLEDAVSPFEKDCARDLVCEALSTFSYDEKTIVRVNPLDTEWGETDLRMVAQTKPDYILVPKATEVFLETTDVILKEVEESLGLKEAEIGIIALIESAYGVENIRDIISASSRVEGILFGAEDYTADLEIKRTKVGRELFYPRCRLINITKSKKIFFIDTPFPDVDDVEGLKFELEEIRALGASGKAAINPRQIDDIHAAFAPKAEDLLWAKKVMASWEMNSKKGIGVYALEGKMIDAPVMLRAKKVLEQGGCYEQSV